jgi:hypothetical protein
MSAKIVRWALRTGAVVMLASLAAGMGETFGSPYLLLDSCGPAPNSVCLTKNGGQYPAKACHETSGSGECMTCWAAENWICPGYNEDIPNARDQIVE